MSTARELGNDPVVGSLAARGVSVEARDPKVGKEFDEAGFELLGAFAE